MEDNKVAAAEENILNLFGEGDTENLDGKLNGFDLFGNPIERKASGPIAERFVIPPFTVLDARQGDWKERKRAWLSLGIRSEIGRGDDATPTEDSGDEDGEKKPRHLASTYKNLGSWTKEITGSSRGEESGISVFDPTLCECVYRWFSAPGAQVVDPFAGGSVRGIVAGMLGRQYWGCDLRQEQVEANNGQADEIIGNTWYGIDEQTPIQRVGNVWLKRDDLCMINGSLGGKARTCWALSRKSTKGLVTAGSRHSPQVALVASMAKALGLPFRAHVPVGDISEGPVAQAKVLGAEIFQHDRGYNSQIIKRAEDDAEELGWTLIPFGMECEEAVTQTRSQVKNLPKDVKRIIVPVGSGMTLCGVLWGLVDEGRTEIPVIGIQVGASDLSVKTRLIQYAPQNWRDMVTIIDADVPYQTHVEASIGSVVLDPVYEAKCLKHVQDGDLLWVVGHRDMVATTSSQKGVVRPQWVCGDSTVKLAESPEADLIFSCPPYGDLERYSDDPSDLSTMGWDDFKGAYAKIIKNAVDRLKPNRFACFVVGDFRDKRGYYQDFVSSTIQAFREAGADFYNDAILVTPFGTAPLRATRQFDGGRKLVKTHQNILVFCKGDWKKAAEAAKG